MFTADVPAAVLTLDAELKVTAWNDRAERLLGWTAEEQIGQTLLLTAGCERALRACIENASDAAITTWLPDRKYHLKPVHLSAGLTGREPPVLWCILLPAEAAVRSVLDSQLWLVKKICHDLRAPLIEITDACEKFDKARSDSPASAAVPPSQGWLARRINRRTKERLGAAKHPGSEAGPMPGGFTPPILNAVTRQQQVLGSLERFAGAGTRAGSFVVDLKTIVTMIAPSLARSAEGSFQVTAEDSAQAACVHCDPMSLERLLQSLISSAGRVVNAQGHIAVTAFAAGDVAVIRVGDSGPPLTEQELPALFLPLRDAQGISRRSGLADVWGLAHACGAEILPGRSLHEPCFFDIVFRRDDAGDWVEVNQSARGTETILIVNDNQLELYLARDVLRSHGYVVFCADNPREALEILQASAGPIHLVLTDLNLPFMDGFELIRQLRIQHPAMLVAISTCSDSPSDRQRAENIPFRHSGRDVAEISGLAGFIRTILDNKGKESSNGS